jgi:hypothetical protein
MDTYPNLPVDPGEQREPFRWVKVASSAMKAIVASLTGVLVFLFIGMRALNPALIPWSPGDDQQMVAEFTTHLNDIVDTLQKFLALIPFLAAAFGGFWNAYKNWDRPKG